MSDEKPKYNTFRDLRSVKPAQPANPPSSTSTTSPPSTSSSTRTSRTTSTAKRAAVAPERDFTRVPNSVARQAVPERVFRGKSKQVYDYLWSVSRGAVIPSRTVRKSRKEIQKGSGLGSMVTVDAALEHLQSVGLISKRPSIGSLSGNEYEVFTYEEASTSISSSTSIPSLTQNLVELDKPESSSTSTTQVFDSQRTYEAPKTSLILNTERTTDDEAMPTLRARVGKPMPKTEALLLALLDTLESRTDVSSPDALLAYVLARKLAPRATVGQRRPNEEQFRGGASNVEVTAEDLEEYERARAELSKNEEGK